MRDPQRRPPPAHTQPKATTTTTTPVSGAPKITFAGGSPTMKCPTSGCPGPATGNDLTVEFSSHPWTSISSFCMTFTFSGDLLGGPYPGDWLGWHESGQSDLAPFPQSNEVTSRTWCASDPKTFAARLDGHATIDVYMVIGSVHIQNITVAVSGTPA